MWRKAESDRWISPDGGLAVEQLIGSWSATGEIGRWVILSDARTGQIFLDLSAVRNTRVDHGPDGAILVWLEHGRDVGLIRVDPAGREARNLGRDDGQGFPLDQLQAEVEAELRAMAASSYFERAYSPDGAIRVDFSIEAWRMSHETRSPRVVDTGSRRVLLDLPSDWDAHIIWQDDGAFLMHLRRYTKQGFLTVTVDPRGGVYRVAQDGDQPCPLDGMGSEIGRIFDRVGLASAEAPAEPPRRTRYLGLALVGSLALLAAIFLIAWLSAAGGQDSALAEPIRIAISR